MRIRKKAILSLILALGMFTTQMLPADAYQKEIPINQQNNAYDENEIVTLIVELETVPLAQSKNTRSSVNEEMLMEEHEEIRSDIQHVIAPKLRSSLTSEYDYTKVFNGFTLETEYGNIDKIKAIDGVKNVYVSQAKKLVEPVESTQEIPEYNSYVNMVNAPSLWAKGIKGQGKKIAIIDDGLDLKHEAFQQIDKNSISMTKSDVADILEKNELHAEELADINVDDVYYNEKVPFQFDYADHDANVCPDEDYIDIFSHGTHVAGIAAGYKESEDGVIEFSGVAPQAQLMIMKVYSKTEDAYTEDILAALEDCYTLNVDTINISSGIDAGFTDEESPYNTALEVLETVGIDVIYAGGNSTDSATNVTEYGQALTTNPDRGIVGKMSTSNNVTSVASIDNDYKLMPVISLRTDEKEIFMNYKDSDILIKTLVKDGEESTSYFYETVGLGKVEDFEEAIKSGKTFENKIAVIKRGEISFTEKVANAAANGAIGVVIYNNVFDDDLDIGIENQTIPACMITLKEGEILEDNINNEDARIIVYKNQKYLPDVSGGKPSDFTSMGCTPDLKLKPEISAPGGNIYSAVPSADSNVHNTYGMMSGTSMATPNYSGVSTLLRQYLKTNDENISKVESKKLISKILMSTATPAIDDKNQAYYSPRIQGAGVANVENAIDANAYLSVSDEKVNEKSKIELGDDPEKTGVYQLNFEVYNTSNDTQRYTIDTTVLMDGIDEIEGENYISKTAYPLNKDEVTIEAPENVEVKGNSSTEVSVILRLTKAGKKRYEAFENGDFIEGFVQLKNKDNETTLTIPYLGFYGDWAQAPILDEATWLNGKIADTYPLEMYTKIQDDDVYLGRNLYQENQEKYDENTLYISPNNDGYMDEISKVYFGQYRNAKKITYQVKNAQGNVVFKEETYHIRKTLYDSEIDMVLPFNADSDKCVSPFTGRDENGKVLPDGEYTYKIKAAIDYKTSEGNALDHYDIKFTIDTKKPSVNQVNVEKDNDKYTLVATVQDENSLMGYRILDENGNVLEQVAYGDEKKGTIQFDASNYASKTLTIETQDYACNKTEKKVLIPADETKPVIITDITIEGKQSLKVGQTTQLKAIVKPENTSVENLKWSSSNKEVVSVDENGLVKAIKEGNATITVKTENGVTGTINIKVEKETEEPIVITDITIEGKQSLKVGETQQLKASVKPENANIGKLTWLSSDSNIATVDENGLVKGIKEGKASISVTTENGVTDKLDITIAKASVTPDSSDKKEEGSKESIDKTTDTGDYTNMQGILLLFGLSSLSLIYIYRKRKA